MNRFDTPLATIPQPGRARPAVRLAALAGGLALLGACAATPQAPSAAAPVPQDPLAAFAAQAAPGAQGRVTLADGQSANVRMVRSYHAASGRECREVLVGTGMSQRSQLVCQGEGGNRASTRPLLRGGGTIRQ